MTATLVMLPVKAQIDTITLDASVREEHHSEIAVTEYPVETGAAITDHARPRPEEVTLEGVVSNTPLSYEQTRQILLKNGVSMSSRTATDYISGESGYAEGAYYLLRNLRDNPRLVTIVTSLYTYDNMAMTSLTIPRDASNGDSFRFEARFKHVRQVTNATTIVATRQPKAKPKVTTSSSTFTPPEPNISEAGLDLMNRTPVTGG